MNIISNEQNNEKYYYFGHDIFGPFLFGFTCWLNNCIERNKYDKIFFLARDGFMMTKAYNILRASKIPYKYIYCSRNSLRSGLIWKCESYEETLKYLGYTKYIPFSELISYYGLNKDDVCDFLNKYDINIDDDYEYETLSTNNTVHSFYNEYHDLIIEKSKNQYELVKRYLSQIEMVGHCAIVDIGWHGSMQLFLEQYLAKSGTTLDGYYVGVDPLNGIVGKTQGWLYNSENEKMRKKLLCFFGVIEKFFQSHEGSTKCYLKKNGIIEVIKEKYEYESDRDVVSKITELQNGALTFIEENKNNKIKGEYITKYSEKMIRFGVNPTLAETKIFSFLYNVDGTKAYFLPQKELFQYRPKEFMHALSNSCWKTGFMKNAFKIPGPYFFIYDLLKK